MKSTWVIGDIHGYSRTLRELVRRLNLAGGDRLITIGDYLDRGPDSKGVIDFLLHLRSQGIDLIPLQGNHEGMYLDLLNIDSLAPPKMQSSQRSLWIASNGYPKTAASYGWTDNLQDLIDGRCRFPDEHLDFLRNLIPYIIEEGQFLCVHAGLPKKALQVPVMLDAVRSAIRTEPDALLWERTTFEVVPKFPGLIIHGHTTFSQVPDYVVRPSDFLNLPKVVHGKLNIDSGIVSSQGKLTAVRIPDLKFVQVDRIEP